MIIENRRRLARAIGLACWLGIAIPVIALVPARQDPRDAAARTAPPVGTSRITGQVVAADTGTPVKRATVNIMRRAMSPQIVQGGPARGRGMVQMGVVGSEAGGQFPPQITDDAGRFEFGDLPAGLYGIMVAPRSGFVRPNSQQVEVDDGKTATIAIKLQRTGVITGRLLDESGEPLPRARVQAMRRDRYSGTVMFSGNSNGTDDLGQFRIFDLPPGEYVVNATDANYASMNAAGPTQGYAPTYFPGSPSLDGARVVVVKSGQETSGIEFSLAKVAMGRITGTLRDSSGQVVGGRGSVSITRRAEEGFGFNRGASVRQDGTYVVSEIPPGDYYIVAALQIGEGPNAVREGVYVPVSVSGNETAIDLQTNKGATVRGRVVLEGTPPALPPGLESMARPEAMRASVSARPMTSGGGLGMVTGMTRPAVVAEDGTFELTGIRGPVIIAATGGRAALKTVTSGADDLTAQPLEFKGTERLSNVTVALTYDVGSIDGRVTDERGEPLPGAAVLVFPEGDEARWFQGSPFVHVSRTAPAGAAPTAQPATSATPGMPGRGPRTFVPGSFLAPTLLPGRYLVAAFQSDMMPTATRDVLERLRKHAVSVAVAAGAPTPVTVRAVRDF